MNNEDSVINNDTSKDNHAQLRQNIKCNPVPTIGHGLRVRDFQFIKNAFYISTLVPVVPSDSQERAGNRQHHSEHDDEGPEKR